jgi:hypothetical protein
MDVKLWDDSIRIPFNYLKTIRLTGKTKSTGHKMCVNFPLELFLKNFFCSNYYQRITLHICAEMHVGLHVVSIIVIRFWPKSRRNVSTHFSKLPNIKFHKDLFGSSCIVTRGQTDMRWAHFCNSVMPKNLSGYVHHRQQLSSLTLFPQSNFRFCICSA